MMRDELAWQARAVDGETRPVCDRCGRPLPATPAAWEAEPVPHDTAEDLRLCADCRAGLERGDVDLALELDTDE